MRVRLLGGMLEHGRAASTEMGITRIAGLMLAVGLALDLESAPNVHGEEKSVTIRLELRSSRQPGEAFLKPAPETVREDAARAISEIEAQTRVEKLIREVTPSPHLRPDLNYDVVSGIQSRHLTNILRPR